MLEFFDLQLATNKIKRKYKLFFTMDINVNLLREKLVSHKLTGKYKFLAQGLFSVYLLEGEIPTIVKIITNEKMAQSEFFSLEYFFQRQISVPAPYGFWKVGNVFYLAMEFIPSGSCSKERAFVECLSRLYSIKNEEWGWEQDNFIGSLTQKNIKTKNFFEYFWKTRFLPQIELGIQKRLLNESHKKRLETLLNKTESWGIHKIEPRLIHGDLWAGNAIWSSKGMYLIDLSPAYGHPEQDLGMAHLFGGFPISKASQVLENVNIDSYGYLDRVPFWQIYPLLVHVNLFGSSYLSQLEAAIRKYE